ncbi:PD-(D/E)XK nuclease family protein [Achromobacter xylosoxidans]|jgi:hypothetical protein|uniref:PDDEXK-like family protein n=1 Tax=Alcaligenes xylosoxydans xylosoxydans TaxID=85698 RepID=UPI001F134EE7|nr:PD-(D/E)XK nuclease family protein [Achromobacter xylosoxidans]WOB71105.1 PD-(D/E)XK nuclease family protein [Achromobacter xylosoxidans]
MTDFELDQFMSDPDLAHILEQAKVSDDVFDVVDLRETQHSDMLAWCLNPNEGHAQGDSVIKDFLLAAWDASADAKYANKTFFEAWRPATIRTTSFGAAFLTRELGFDLGHDSKKSRLDLFLVDPVNKIVVTIENKAGRKLSASQLTEYWDAVRSQVASRRAFQDYKFAFVVVDREANENTDLGVVGNKWILMDYSWLKISATRAQYHIDRSNHAARLLMAYCQRQTDDWQSENERRLIDRAGTLAVRHVNVIDRLRELRRERITSWTPSLVNSADGDLLRFYHQHRLVCQALLQGSGIAAVASSLKKLRPDLPGNMIDMYRKRLALGSEMAELCMDEDVDEPEWPVYVAVRRFTSEESEEARFQVRLIWISSAFASQIDVEKLRSQFERAFPPLKTHKMRNIRRITLISNATAEVAAKQACLFSEKVEKLLKEYLDVVKAEGV